MHDEGAVMRIRSKVSRVFGMVLAVALVGACQSFAALPDAALTGVVRDIHGVPQMGALVQVLSADASVIGTAFTDNHGRYLIPSVLPGRYQLRATAAFFCPHHGPMCVCRRGRGPSST